MKLLMTALLFTILASNTAAEEDYLLRVETYDEAHEGEASHKREPLLRSIEVLARRGQSFIARARGAYEVINLDGKLYEDPEGALMAAIHYSVKISEKELKTGENADQAKPPQDHTSLSASALVVPGETFIIGRVTRRECKNGADSIDSQRIELTVLIPSATGKEAGRHNDTQ